MFTVIGVHESGVMMQFVAANKDQQQSGIDLYFAHFTTNSI